MNTTASKKKDEPPVAANGNHNYFAIASMMKPTSLKGREITPIRSQPAMLVDYKLRFFGTMGYAEAVACPGYRGFHGVVHTVSEHDMKILNDIEHIYTPTIAAAELYDGETIPVTVYCGSKENEETNDRMPQERYLDIMIEGAQHFGVKQEYIDFLRSLEYEPRPKPEEFLSFGSTPSNVPTMSLNEVMKQDGEDGRPLYAIVNGKVLEIVNPTPERSFLFRMLRHKLQHCSHRRLFAQDCLRSKKSRLNVLDLNMVDYTHRRESCSEGKSKVAALFYP